MKKKIDNKKKIVDQLVEMIEKNPKAWDQPWRNMMMLPTRSTGETYRGINLFLLGITAQCEGYKSQHWFTYRQANELGAQVRKGEKSTTVCYYTQFIPKSEKSKPKAEQKAARMLKTFNVFNGDQIDNLPERFSPKKYPNIKHEDSKIRQYVETAGASVHDGGDVACYVPSLDIIKMPNSEAFKDTESWSATLLHETIHWTGHKSRLDRSMNTDSTSAEYGLEELVAELGSVLLCAELGVAREPRDEAASYLKAWLRRMKEDPQYLFTAFSAASKSVTFLENAQSSVSV